MIQIFIVSYLMISLAATLLLWTVLRAESRSFGFESLGNDLFFESKMDSINFYFS
jgi:hypothetical protein